MIRADSLEARALVPQCGACGAAPGRRCTQHLTSEVYRTVHHVRGRAAGLTANEILSLDFGDLAPTVERDATDLEQLHAAARPDDVRLVTTIAGLALDLAAQAGANQREIATLRGMLRRCESQAHQGREQTVTTRGPGGQGTRT